MNPFGPAAAEEAAAHWGFGPGSRLELLCVSENATYLLTDPLTQARGVLRLNRPGYHCRQAIESELAWTAALRREGVITTPASLRTRQGTRVAVLEAGVRHAVMFTFAEGAEPEPASADGGMPVIGELAARLHAHSRRWLRPRGFTRFAWDLPAAFGTRGSPGRWGDWHGAHVPDPEGVATLEAAQALVVSTLESYGQGRQRFGLIHGDLRAANLLVVDGAPDPVTVIDFDDCGLSWFGYDAAAAVSFLEHEAALGEMVAGFLSGYRRIAPFGKDDVAAIPALIMLRRLQLLAWSASHADTEMVRSLGPQFGAQSVVTAEKYLSGTLLAGLD